MCFILFQVVLLSLQGRLQSIFLFEDVKTQGESSFMFLFLVLTKRMSKLLEFKILLRDYRCGMTFLRSLESCSKILEMYVGSVCVCWGGGGGGGGGAAGVWEEGGGVRLQVQKLC